MGKVKKKKKKKVSGSEENKQAAPTFYHLPVINQKLLGMLAGEIDPLFTQQIDTKEWSESKWVAEGRVSESFIQLHLSDQTEVSTPGFSIFCPRPSLLLPRFFHVYCFFCSCEPFFLSAFSLSVGAAEAALRHCSALNRLLPPPAPS